jgi:septal ring factor EnvC (AmiA/AmiB activator)
MFSLYLQSIEAVASSTTYETSLYTGTVSLFLLLLAIVIVMMKKSSSDKKVLEEREEKIAWLRQIHAENEFRCQEQIKELEKEILKLTHTIESLEIKLKEGTKNQVVEKIEALQNKRKSAQSRLDV